MSTDRPVFDGETLPLGTKVRVVGYGFGARKGDVGRWGEVNRHQAGHRPWVDLAANSVYAEEVRRLHPDETVVEVPDEEPPASAGELAQARQIADAAEDLLRHSGRLLRVAGDAEERGESMMRVALTVERLRSLIG